MTNNGIKTPTKSKQSYNVNGQDFEDVEHFVLPDNQDMSYCGVDQTDVPWDQGFPPCQACIQIMRGGMN